MLPRRPCISGLPGRSGDAPEAEFHSAPGEGRAHEVVLADRRAAERHEDVRASPLGREDAILEGLDGVERDSKVERFPSGFLHHRADGVGVRRHDLVGSRLLSGPHQLVAGREDRDAGPAAHGQDGVPHRGGEREAFRVEPLAGREERIASAEIEPRGADVLVRAGSGPDDHGAVLGLGVLLDRDGVCARRHRRAGKDPHRLAGRQGAGKAVARPTLAPTTRSRRRHRRGVFASHRVAVHGGSRERRLVARGAQVLGEGPPGGRGDRHPFRLDRPLDAREHPRQGLVDRQEAHGAS